MPVDISFREMEQDFAGNVRSVVKGDMTTEDFTKYMMIVQNMCLLEHSPIQGHMWNYGRISRYILTDILNAVRTNNKDFTSDFKAIFKYAERIEEHQMKVVVNTLIAKYRDGADPAPRGEGGAGAGPAPQARGEGGAGAGPASMDSKELDSALAKATTAKIRAELRVAELMEELVAARIAQVEAQKVLDDLNSRKRKRD